MKNTYTFKYYPLPGGPQRASKDETKPTLHIGYATLTIGDAFVVENIRVLQQPDGNVFPSMPSAKRRKADGEVEWRDIAHPITAEDRQAIIDALKKAVDEAGAKEG